MITEVGPGSLSVALGLLLGGLAIFFPENRWIGLLFLIAAVAMFFFDVRFTGWHLTANLPFPTRRPIAFYGMSACAIGACAFALAYFWPTPTPPIGFEKFVLYFVKWDDGIYRLGVTGQLQNHENKALEINAINYHGGAWTIFPRGFVNIQRYAEFSDQSDLPDEATNLLPHTEGYFKKTLKIRLFMTHLSAQDTRVPNLLLRGDWEFVVGKESYILSPLRFAVAPKAISREEWDALDRKSAAGFKAVAVPARPLNEGPGSKGKPTYTWYLLYSPDRSETLENPYFQKTPYAKSPAGVMVFAYANSSVPIDGAWTVLGHTYHEAWSNQEALASYNSVFPPDKNGNPRAFGYFQGCELEMLGGAQFSPAPVSSMGNITEFQTPKQ
jgi:hypothetical protein